MEVSWSDRKRVASPRLVVRDQRRVPRPSSPSWTGRLQTLATWHLLSQRVRVRAVALVVMRSFSTTTTTTIIITDRDSILTIIIIINRSQG